MPENPEKKLGGYIVESSTSNAAIERTLKGLEREILGVVGEPTDVVVTQALPPENIGKTSRVYSSAGSANVTRLPIEKFTHKDSALANSIHRGRVLKKAA